MRERVFVMRRVTMRRTHRRFEAVAGPGTARRRVGHRKPAVAAEGSNHPDPGEGLNAAYLVSISRMGHIIVRTHPEEGSTVLDLVDSSPC